MTDRYAEICGSHWRQFESDDEHAARVEWCTNEANKYLAPAAVKALNECHQTMRDIAPYRDSPRWQRMKEAAERKYLEDTAPAFELFLRTFEELMRDGECSEETSESWDELDRAEHRRDERKHMERA